jgi:hypothetical protein
MFTLKTGTAAHYDDTETGQTLLAVPFEIVDDAGVVVQALKESFDLNATAEDITAVLQRHLAVFTEDHQRHEGVRVAQEARDASAAEAEKISNITL